MGVDNRDFVAGAGGRFPSAAFSCITLAYDTQVPASQTDLEILSVKLPSNYDWQIVSAHVWVKGVTGSNAKTVNIQDDGTDIGTDTTVVAGTQTSITGVAGDKVKGGSELQVTATTGAATTIDDCIVVTIWLRPYPLAEAGVAVS